MSAATEKGHFQACRRLGGDLEERLSRWREERWG